MFGFVWLCLAAAQRIFTMIFGAAPPSTYAFAHVILEEILIFPTIFRKIDNEQTLLLFYTSGPKYQLEIRTIPFLDSVILLKKPVITNKWS